MTLSRAGRLAVALWALACSPGVDREVGRDAAAAPAPADATPDVTPRCRPATGVSASPATIAEVVDLVNALPRPVTLACFLESLDRPLFAYATRNSISLQPGMGVRSPRVFLFLGRLMVSVVPAGMGSRLAELGEFVDAERSVKGEIEFPLADALEPSHPFEEVRDVEGTTCRACHPSEERAPQIPYAEAYVSGALRPPVIARVALETLRAERQACIDANEPARCAVLRALFDHGEVQERSFSAALPTIFD